jgi:hypothetical protein
MLKVYQSKQFINRSIYVMVDGVSKLVEFKGGQAYPKKIFGVFATDSVKVQKALESHLGYGKTFELISEEKKVVKPQEVITLMEPKKNTPEPIVVEEDVIEETMEDQAEEIQEESQAEEVEETVEEVEETIQESPVVEERVGPREIFEIEKAQDAKLWLMNEFKNEFTHRQLANKDLILKAAKEKNVVFPNLK